MDLYGITGGIGSGKSAVTKILREMGFSVLDLDEISRDLVSPESEGLSRIVEEFGAQYLTLEGTLNRKLLAALVFSDRVQLSKLDAIMGPLIREELQRRRRSLSGRLAFVDGALLIEKRMYKELSGTILVIAPKQVRLQRAMVRDDATAEQVEARMQHQMTDEEKQMVADFVIENTGTLAELAIKIRHLIKELCP